MDTETSGHDALDRLATDPVDCIVSDYQMPETDGLELLTEVREQYPDLPFILFTGKGSEEVASDAITAGATDYLQKETGTDQYTILANRIVNAVEQYRTREAMARTERRLVELADQSRDVLWLFDAAWTELLFVNEAYEDIYGGSIAELHADPSSFLDAVHPEDRGRVQDAMERLSAGESVDIEYRVNESEDYERRVWVQGDPILEDGEVVRIGGFTRDVTDQRP